MLRHKQRMLRHNRYGLLLKKQDKSILSRLTYFKKNS